MPAIVIIDQAEFPHAPAYYRMCTWEPIGARGSLVLGRIFPVRPLTIERILDVILAQYTTPNGTVITVHHANPDGIVLPLVQRQRMRASRDALNLLTSGRSASSIAEPLRLPEADVARLQGKMQRVQALTLARLEIRGCRLGQSESTMRAVKRFFGAACIGAPTVFNAYGELRPVTRSPTFNYESLERVEGGNHYRVGSDGHVGMVFDRTGRTSFRMGNIRATTEQVYRRWFITKFPVRNLIRMPAGTSGATVEVYMDMRSNEIDADPFDDVPLPASPIHFQLTEQDELHLPLEQDYRNNLREICGGADDGLGGLAF